MMLADQALDALLKRLHLANTRRAWRDSRGAPSRRNGPITTSSRCS